MVSSLESLLTGESWGTPILKVTRGLFGFWHHHREPVKSYLIAWLRDRLLSLVPGALTPRGGQQGPSALGQGLQNP